MGTEYLHQRMTVGIRFTQVTVEYGLCRDLEAVQFHIALNTQDIGRNGIQIEVQVFAFAGFLVRLAFGRIP